jgi:hypothetical protein
MLHILYPAALSPFAVSKCINLTRHYLIFTLCPLGLQYRTQVPAYPAYPDSTGHDWALALASSITTHYKSTNLRSILAGNQQGGRQSHWESFSVSPPQQFLSPRSCNIKEWVHSLLCYSHQTPDSSALDSQVLGTTGVVYHAQLHYTFFFFAVLGFELRAYNLSHSTSHFFVMGFFSRHDLSNYLARMASNCDPPDLCLLSS